MEFRRVLFRSDLSAKFAAEKIVLRHGCPGLVTGAEAKLRGEAVDREVIARAIAGLRDQPGGDRMDVIVLACTHFPLLQDEFQAAAGPDVRLSDGAAGIARRKIGRESDGGRGGQKDEISVGGGY